jgi:hypothetical protein
MSCINFSTRQGVEVLMRFALAGPCYLRGSRMTRGISRPLLRAA